MSHWEEAPGKTQDTVEKLYPSAGLGMPWSSPGQAGGQTACPGDKLFVCLSYMFRLWDDVLLEIF